MDATVYVLNVEHGDSSVVHIRTDSGDDKWILIDTNRSRRGGTATCPAVDFLKKAGAKAIDLLIVSHLHVDHFNGLDSVFGSLDVKKLIIPPFIRNKSGQYRKTVLATYKKKILDVAKSSGSNPTVNSHLRSLASLFDFINRHDDRVEEAAGPESIARIPGLASPCFTVHLPLRSMKGVLLQIIEDESFDIDWFPSMNDSSVVVSLELHGTTVLWGADATTDQWREHQRRMKRDDVNCLRASAFKVPHHGSRHNNDAGLYAYVLAPPLRGRLVVVSANGVSHPHDEFFTMVDATGLVPYCTNLASQCMSSELYTIDALSQVPAAMKAFLVHARAYRQAVPCQGDITLSLRPSGLSIANSTGAPCVYEPGIVRPRLPVL